MSSGYDYGNARLRAMRSRLLTETDYHSLLAKKNIEELITALTETPYQADIEAALARFHGTRCVFEAGRTNLIRTLRQIRGFFEAGPGALVDLLLRYYDRQNLLAILRGQSQEIPPEMIVSALIPVGKLDEVSLRELARQPGLRAVIDLMTAWQLPYAQMLRRVQPRIGTLPDLDQLELALNRFHYTCLYQKLGHDNRNQAIFLEHLQIEIDLVNLVIALRLAHRPDLIPVVQQRYHAADVRPLLIEPDGHLSAGRLAELVAQGSGLEGLVRGLSDTCYGPPLAAGWRRHQAGEGGLTVFERELERWQGQHFMAMFTRNPLSLAIPIGYIGCKRLEVANLRLIAQAVALGLKRDGVQRELIML
jgi:vacuolar-type H+-ATPase subunit C/Vma6